MMIIYRLMLRVNVSLGHCSRLLPQNCWNWCPGKMRFLCVSLTAFTNICQPRSPYMALAQDMEGCTLWHEPPGWGGQGWHFPGPKSGTAHSQPYKLHCASAACLLWELCATSSPVLQLPLGEPWPSLQFQPGITKCTATHPWERDL